MNSFMYITNRLHRLSAFLINKSFAIFVIVSAVLFVVFNVVYLQFIGDDSFITFRYAKNLVNHGVWNWNPDNQRVEAYTNFIYAVIAIIPHIIGIEPQYFFKIFSFAMLIFVLYRLRSISPTPGVFSLGLLVTLCNPYWYIHFYSGLETPLFIILILEVIYINSRTEVSLNMERYFYLLLLILPLTRPEGIVFSVTGFVVYTLVNKRKIRALPFLLAIIFVGFMYFLIRAEYFGYILPNTFYAKTIQGSRISNIINNILSARVYLICTAFLFVFVPRLYFRCFVIASMSVFLFLYAPSSLQTNYADRFAFQLFIPVLLASLMFFDSGRFMNVAMVSVFMSFGVVSMSEVRAAAINYPRSIHSNKDIGLRLSKFKDKGYTLMVGDVGMVSYYSEWKCYDFVGLADTEISHMGMSIEYMRRTNPDLILFYSSIPDPSGIRNSFGQHVMLQYVRDTNKYEYIAASQHSVGYYFISFLKKDIKDFDAVKNELLINQDISKNFHPTLKGFLLFQYMQ